MGSFPFVNICFFVFRSNCEALLNLAVSMTNILRVKYGQKFPTGDRFVLTLLCFCF